MKSEIKEMNTVKETMGDMYTQAVPVGIVYNDTLFNINTAILTMVEHRFNIKALVEAKIKIESSNIEESKVTLYFSNEDEPGDIKISSDVYTYSGKFTHFIKQLSKYGDKATITHTDGLIEVNVSLINVMHIIYNSSDSIVFKILEWRKIGNDNIVISFAKYNR